MAIQKIALTPQRLQQAKWAYTTRCVDPQQAAYLLQGELKPQAGDLVLARVDDVGQHQRLELVTSRRATLFEEDEIVVVYGNRYAPDQFEGIVPDRLEPCRLVAAGGVAARLLNRHARMKHATKITPLGLLAGKDSERLNLRHFRLPRSERSWPRSLVLVVAGTAMNAGKTTACANLVKGMVRRGMKVAAAKITGTGAGADYRTLVDAGADPVYDFVDAGYVSTYRLNPKGLIDVVTTLSAHLMESGPDIVVLEVADGLLQTETARLFVQSEFTRQIDGIMFAANDALGAQAGVAWLAARQLPVIGVTGQLTSSPLAIREAEAAVGLPVYATSSLRRSNVAGLIHKCLTSRRSQMEKNKAEREVVETVPASRAEG